MLEQFLYILPLLILLGGVFALTVKKFEANATPQCFKLSRLILIISLVLSIIFYNRPMVANLSLANYSTLLFICWLFTSALVILHLAQKWFNTMQQSGASFCRPLVMAVLSGCLLIISKNLFLTTIALILLIFANMLILWQSHENKHSHWLKGTPLKLSLFFGLLIIIIMGKLYYTCGTTDYNVLQIALAQNQHLLVFAAVCCLLLAFVFLLAAAPLHYWLLEIATKASLPVLIYFMLVPTTLSLIGLTRLNMMMLLPLSNSLQIFYVGIGIMSIFVGAISACSSSNIRQILICSIIYNMGVIFFILQHFSLLNVQTAIVYWFICWLAYVGIGTSLFCFKSKGEYLFAVEQFANAAYQKPYATLMVTLFLFSLLGVPPLSGSLGLFAVLNELAGHNHFYSIVYILSMLIIMSYAYLSFIQKLYFANSRNNFDRSGMDLHILLFFVAVIMVLITIEPRYLMEYPWIAEIFHG